MKKEPCICKKSTKAWMIVIGAILALLMILYVIAPLVTTVIFHDFFGDARKEFRIPGQADGLVSQGFTFLWDQQFFLQCGFMADGKSASRIYVTPMAQPESSYYIELVKPDGTPYTGHTGGIASSGNFIWLANDGKGEDNCVWVLSLYDFFRLEAGESYTLTTYFKPETRASFCFVDQGYLWVGEFYNEADYPTEQSHHYTVSGKTNHSLIARYAIDANSPTGIAEGGPSAFLSIPDHVQGADRDQYGHFILSTSYGISKSHFLFYEDVMTQANDTVLTVDGKEVPVWYLDDDVLKRDLECPPMSEDIVLYGNRIYYLTESASHKYIFGNFTRGRHVFSLPLEH